MRVFVALGTQWRALAGMAGAVWLGLDYQAIPAVLRLLGIPRREWPEIFGGLQTMESAALGVLNE